MAPECILEYRDFSLAKIGMFRKINNFLFINLFEWAHIMSLDAYSFLSDLNCSLMHCGITRISLAELAIHNRCEKPLITRLTYLIHSYNFKASDQKLSTFVLYQKHILKVNLALGCLLFLWLTKSLLSPYEAIPASYLWKLERYHIQMTDKTINFSPWTAWILLGPSPQ